MANQDSSLVEVNQTLSSKIPFGELCKLFERIKKSKTNVARHRELHNFINKWRDHYDSFHKDIIKEGKQPKDSFFPIIRLLLPQMDRARPSYGVKETVLAKIYIEALGLSKSNPDAKKMLEYRNPKTNVVGAGDFAEIAYVHVLSKRCVSDGSLSIHEINEHLDDLARYNNERKRDMFQRKMSILIRSTSAEQQKWLIRILLKDLKTGMGQNAILNAFHKDAEELFNVTTNLEEVCMKLYNPSVEISDAEIRLSKPFRPMLAFNAKLSEVESLMSQQEFRLEIKYDGERSQLHKYDGQYKYFSRSGKEYSQTFGESPYTGSLTPHIHSQFAQNVKSCILDGEMMGYRRDLKIFMQKGREFDVKHIFEDSDLQPCFVAFDILHLNGKCLATEPLHRRLRVLESVFTPTEGRIQLAEAKSATKNQEVSDYLNSAIDRCEEGIIVKCLTSTYAPNKRKGSGWFKIKPDYVSGVVDDLDLVIVGGKFGSGRHANLINKFMLAVRDGEGSTAKYKSFSMVGSGYSNKELLEVTETLKSHLVVFYKKSPPDWLVVARDVPEVVVHPEKSIVVQVRAAEIIPSSAFATKCTLRFPRIVCTRSDKSARDAMDVDQLTRLREMAEGKLATRHASLTRERTPKKRKLDIQPQGTVSARFLGTDLSKVEQSSNGFEGHEICVIHVLSKPLKHDLEKSIASFGGSVVSNPTANTTCVVAENEKNIRVRSIIKSKKNDVVSLNWLQKCLEHRRYVPYSPVDMIFITEGTKSKMASSFDKYGDGYELDIDDHGLMKLMASIPGVDANSADATSVRHIDEISTRYVRYGLHERPASLFIGLHFFICGVPCGSDMSCRLREIKSLIKFFNGVLDQELSIETSHCVYIPNTTPRNSLEDLLSRRATTLKKFHVVSDDWVIDCVEKGNLVPEKPFEYAHLRVK